MVDQFHNYDESLEERNFFFQYRKKHYVLREPSGEAATQYRDKIISCMQYGADGKPNKAVGLAATEPLLVSLCVFEIEVDANGEVVPGAKEKPVAQATVRQWPARMQKELFEKAKRFGDLNEETPERQTLDEILSREDSPVSLEVFREYIAGLPDMDEKHDYRPFKQWYTIPAEELAKNEQSDMTAGSD